MTEVSELVVVGRPTGDLQVRVDAYSPPTYNLFEVMRAVQPNEAWIDPHGPPPEPPCGAPRTEPSPSAAPIQQIRSEAAKLANLIRQRIATDPGAGRWEWGGFIIYHDGMLGHTAATTSHQTNEVDLPIHVLVPPGAQIVAWVHSHPRDRFVEQRLPSGPDWQVVNRLIQLGDGSRWFTTDPSLMTYIYDPRESDEVREYGPEDRNTDNLGPALTC